MNAQIEQTAVASLSVSGDWFHGEQRPAVVVVDGVRFSSPVPANAGEAETFNRAARSIVAKLNRRAT